MKYVIEFEEGLVIDNTKLEKFISEKLKNYGGNNLLNNTDIICQDNNIFITTDKKYKKDVHVALFLVKDYCLRNCRISLQDK